MPGQIIILNGAPRAGKSSIVREIQEKFEGVWVNIGADVAILGMTPKHLRPGVGLRPGGERPDLEPLVRQMYLALYDSIAAHSHRGLNIVADFGHHDSYSRPLNIWPDCLQLLRDLPVLIVGVRCSIEQIMKRRNEGQAGREGVYETGVGEIPDAVQRWQDEVHKPGIYDLEVDTSKNSPEACAEIIRKHLSEGNPGVALGRLIGS